MSEIPDLSYLEKFRDTRIPFFYWVEDKLVIPQVVKDITSGAYGLETGFGQEPTKSFLLEPRIPWILTEFKQEDYAQARRDLSEYWREINLEGLDIPSQFRMVALKTASTRGMVAQANVLVYRNLDYQEMEIPQFKDLRQGQRMVFIVNDSHVKELPRYRSFLNSNGYEGPELKIRSSHLPKLGIDFAGNKQEYVLDIVKE